MTSQSPILETRVKQFKRLRDIWKNIRKLSHKQIDDQALQGFGILTSRMVIDDTNKEETDFPYYFKPFPAQEFDALPAYDIDDSFPEYRDRHDRSSHYYQTGYELYTFFAHHLFHNEWEMEPDPSKFRLYQYSNWTQA